MRESSVIPKPVRRLAVGIRPSTQGIQHCHSPLRVFVMTGAGILRQVLLDSPRCFLKNSS